MKAEHFLDQLQHEEIVAAIRNAETRTSGEIRVFISRKEVDNPMTEAQQQFAQLGMSHTRDRNGVLLFVAPRTRKFAIIGDSAVHARCGSRFWQEVADEMTQDFQQFEYTRGIVKAVTRAGTLLREHFPRRPDDQNELPDEVERD